MQQHADNMTSIRPHTDHGEAARPSQREHDKGHAAETNDKAMLNGKRMCITLDAYRQATEMYCKSGKNQEE